MYDYLSKSISSPIFQAIANINRDDLFLYVKNIDSKYIFLSKNICNLGKIEYEDAIGKCDDDFNWGKEQAEQLFTRNSLIELLHNELIKQSKCSNDDFVSLNKELIKVFSQFLSKELIIVNDRKEIKTKYYNYLVVCLCTMELLKNKTLSEKILINIDKNEIKMMINRAGQKHKININNTKFLANYITYNIIKVLDLKLDIFVIEDSFLPVAITITLSDKNTIY
ncbi:hypothetical protein FSC774_04145 [Francisella noatunensis subsp. noatunensis FSC774]|uniref:hypothetical protein n=1 Tax=Francisella noatunensis TaxID=657445 RepID=UPI001784C7E7|nr:hypothetical protein [Francisella noatunensis]MBK2064066.1 hypothetical protein [Francisella noatunensis]MBK2071453.1 hypothetical protein [Francisella noatunensis]QOG54760.1 hypothetical protein FSC774_04145 [Francisella noatunensis subsp. noatunensis FSC774]